MKVILRKEAKNLGLTRYFTGKECKHGHISERLTKNCGCVVCEKLYDIRYQQKNKEKIKKNKHKNYCDNMELNRTRAKIYYHDNKPQIKEKMKKYREANKEKTKKYHEDNKEKIRKRSSEWAKNNPDKNARHSRFYLWLRKEATPLWYEDELIKQLYLKRNELSKIWGIQLHVDHIVPLQGKNVCGLHCWDNLQLLESSLNRTKSNKF